MLIALVNSKGGVGKTTIAVHLAVWAHELGIDVAFIDADAQEASSRWLAHAKEQFQVVRLQTADLIIEQSPGIDRAHQLVVIDGPAGLSDVTRAIFLSCDLAVVPCGPSALDLRAAHEAMRVLRQAQVIRKGPPCSVLAPNKLQKSTRLSKELLEVTSGLDIQTLPSVHLRQAYAEAVGQGTVVWRLGTYAKEAAEEMRNFLTQILTDKNKT